MILERYFGVIGVSTEIYKLIEERHGNKNQRDLLKIYFEFDNAAADLVADIYKLSDESRGVFVLLEDLKDFYEELINLALKLSQYGYKDVSEIYAEFDETSISSCEMHK